jgi:hypothetical protein
MILDLNSKEIFALVQDISREKRSGSEMKNYILIQEYIQ